MSFIQRLWYQSTPLYWTLKWLFLPFALLFWLLSSLRRHCYRQGWFKSRKLQVPVIVVGNISVGGNGKTPVVVWLANYLQQQGYRPGILSRGYGGKSSFYPASVDAQSDVTKVGDEPVLIKQRVACPVVVDPRRPRGAKYLVDKHGCDLIICDDGLQHYALQRDIEIVVVDGQRRHGNGCVLPMGPLRETAKRLSSVDFVINNGGPLQQGEVLMTVQAEQAVKVADPSVSIALSEWSQPAVATAAIGNPSRFFDMLSAKGIELTDTLAFADHHQYQAKDLPEGVVLMTEKDAVKCRQFSQPDWWFVPINAQLPESFSQQLNAKLNSLKSQNKD